MLENRSYLRPSFGFANVSATFVLVATLVVAFLIQKWLVPVVVWENDLALSLEGLQHGYVWQLVTFQFLHGGWLHLFVNCWAVYIFGRELERMIGAARLLAVYFSSGILGGLLQMLFAWLWPGHFGGAVVGASAGAFGLAAAFATLDAERPLMVLLFFVIPLKMRAKSLLIFCFGLTVLLLALPVHIPFLGNIAHAAHLGGMLTGLFYALWLSGYSRRQWGTAAQI